MKTIVCAVLTVFLCSTAFAQRVVVPSSAIPEKAKVNATDFKALKDAHLNAASNQRGLVTFDLDYDAADNAFSDALGFTYDRFINQVNRNFSVSAPADTAKNFTLKWAAVVFDTLYDWQTETAFPLPTSTITVDSVFVAANHINTNGTDDTIFINVLQIAATPAGILSANMGATLDNTILWADTIISNTSITPGLAAGQFATLSFAPGITLPTGSGFIVQVTFAGDTANELQIIDGNRDECNAACQYAEALIPNTAFSFLNLILGGGSNNLTGLAQNLVVDCDQSGAIEPELCELFFNQNFAIWSQVTVDVPLSVSVANPVVQGCPNTNVSLSATAVGGTEPFVYSWSNGQSGPVISVPVGATDQTLTVTVTDANNDQVTATVLVRSQGVTVDLGADITVACGQRANINPTVTGNVAGAVYTWSNGATTQSLSNVPPGVYQVTITNSAGCTSSDIINVVLTGTSQALNFTIPSTWPRNCPVDIVNTSSNQTGWSFNWDFGDGNLAFGVNASHQWSSIGSFTVTLTADSSSCSVVATRTIQIVNANCTVVGIDEQLLSSLNIYPNPTNGTFVVDMSAIVGETAVIRVLNMEGKIVATERFTATGNDSKQINLSAFSNGLYFVNIQVDGRSASKIVMKQ